MKTLTEIEESRERKPLHGQPCNGCGFCCLAQPCQLSVEMGLEKEGRCLALRFSDGKYECGLVSSPSSYLGMKFNIDSTITPLISQALGVGRGCDSSDE